MIAWICLAAMAAEPEAPKEESPATEEETPAEEGADGETAPAAGEETAEEADEVPHQPSSTPEPPTELTDEERAVAAEARRLRQELVKVARVGRHDAVDRLYRDLVDVGLPIPQDIHIFGADSARALGDMMHCVARLHRGGGGTELADVEERFGTVRLSVTAPDVQIAGAERFAPDETKAVSFANQQLAVDGRFVGMLPVGEYELGKRVLVVPAGGAVSVVID